MPSRTRFVALICGVQIFVASAAFAEMKVDAWARATPPSARVGAVYLSIDTTVAAPDRLVGLSSPAAAKVSVHETERVGDVVRMRPVDGLTVSRDLPVRMQPNGLHLMLEGLPQPLKRADRFPLTLQFERAGEILVEVVVEGPGATGPSTPRDGHHGH